jgi:hypothetical protein
MTQEAAPLTSPPAALAVPIFGRRPGAFGLEVEGKPAPGEREQRWVEEFQCFTDVDGGMWVAMGNARTDLEVAQALVRFMATNLRDDDGVPMDWRRPTEPERASDEPDSDWLRTEPTKEHPKGQPLFLGWDGELYTIEEYPALDELAEGSSRRRFAYISESMDVRYRLEALQEISEWLTEGMTGHPTKQPAPSGRGPARNGRGSGGKRR